MSFQTPITIAESIENIESKKQESSIFGLFNQLTEKSLSKKEYGDVFDEISDQIDDIEDIDKLKQLQVYIDDSMDFISDDIERILDYL